jgi:thioredoxin 1
MLIAHCSPPSIEVPVVPKQYENLALNRSEVDVWTGPALLEFGTNWCGHCQLAQPAVAEALQDKPPLKHVKIEDGPGRPLGRSFRVKLWPTLIFLKDGREVARVVRPETSEEIQAGLKMFGG